MTYKDFFTPEDVRTFQLVKKGTMGLARIAREEAAALVKGHIPTRGTEYVYTNRGIFRLSMGGNSDNTTERAAHRRRGAKIVVMGKEDSLRGFFKEHGLPGEPTEIVWGRKIRERLYQ